MTTGATPPRVTGLDLANQSLSGTIPAGLGRLFGLTTLNLRTNQLTGRVPPELAWLSNLTELRLAGNPLTGCLPPALRRVATHDLGALGLPDCAPPAAPASLTAGTVTATSVPLSWDAVANTSKYRVEYRATGVETWTVADDTLTGTTATVEGLTCATTYEVQVSAYGDGTTRAAVWGAASAPLTVTTGACRAAAPANLTAGTVTPTSIPLRWASVTGAATYRVDARVGGTEAWTVVDSTLTGTTVTLGELGCGTTYEVLVSAFGDGTTLAAAWGEPSGVVTVTTGACALCEPLAIVSPTLTLERTVGARSAVRASWAYRAPCAGLAVTRHSLVLTYDYADGTRAVTGLQARGGSPHYWVVDRRHGGTGASLTRLTWTALDVAYGPDGARDAAITFAEPPRLDFTPPAPANLTAGTVTPTGVPLSWDKVTGASKCRVESRTSGAETWTVADDTLTTTAHTVAGLTCGTAYEFRVSGFGDGTTLAAAWGAASTAVTATTGACLPAPTAPTGLTAGTVTATSVPLRWDVVANSAKYRVESRASGAETWTVADDTLTGRTTTVAGLTCATAYESRVSAFGDGTTLAAAWGAPSTAVSATTGACPPTAGVTVAFGQAAYTVREGASVAVRVVLSAALPDPLSLALAAGGTAGTADVSGVPASVTIAAAATATSFEVTAVADTEDDAGETLTLSLGERPPWLGEGTPATATITIQEAAEPPVFGAASYAFTVAEDAAVPTVAATAATTVAYAITAGNAAGAWAIDGASGALSVAGALDYETTPAYTLTVTASADGATATATVAITVTNVADTLPPAPTSLAAGPVTATSVPLRWDAVANSATYRVEYRTSSATAWTTADDTLTGTTATVDGLTCGSAYAFRVSAYGDGTVHRAAWGQASGAVTATTGICPPPAPTGLTAGPVTATSVPLRWDAVASRAKYRVEYRASGATAWTVADDTRTGTTHTVDGLTCGTTYAFRVSAYGDGTTHAAAWGAPATAVTATTSACPPAGPTVTFGRALSRVQEGTSVTVTVRLSAAAAAAVTIPLTVTGTAATDDVSRVPASVTLSAAMPTSSFEVTAVKDQVVEAIPETLYIDFGTLPDGVAAGQPSRRLLVISDAPGG